MHAALIMSQVGDDSARYYYYSNKDREMFETESVCSVELLTLAYCVLLNS
jgi:hypothetical protein